MKINKIFIAVFTLVALAFAACSEYEDTVIPGPVVPDGTHGVYFPASNSTVFELEPTEATEVVFTVARDNSEAAAEVPLTVAVNDGDVFEVPQTVSFAAGEEAKEFTVTFPEAGEGTTYGLTIALEGDEFVNPYTSKATTLSANVTRIKWEPVEEPMVYIDGTFTALFGVNTLPMYVSAEKAQLGNAVRYRFKNPYQVPTGEWVSEDEYVGTPDADGIYDGYPYNFPGDVDETNDYYLTVEIDNPAGTSGNVTMLPAETGTDWSYGMISIGSAANKSGSLVNNLITFPADALFFSMADYNAGARYAPGAPTLIYLTKDAFIAANMKIDDYNDVEYEEVAGEVGEFVSGAYSETWNAVLAKAIDIDAENEESEYKDLYYLADLYSEGYGLAFYHTESGSVKIPENQPIGREVFGQELFVSPSDSLGSAVETTSKGVTVYNLGLTFHLEDGTLLGDFNEKFYFAESEIVYEESDLLGNFNMTGISQFSGRDDADMDVVIAEGTEENTFIITGIAYAEEVVATFDAAANTLTIAPQELADVVIGENTYDATWYSTDATGVSATSVIELEFNLDGNLVLSDESEADGYVIQTVAGNGFFDGYYNLQFSPVEEVIAGLSTKSATAQKFRTYSEVVSKENSANGSVNNFKVQGKKSNKNVKRINR